jgi:ABC-type antimicrobial peptide transport system permease subunit
MSVVVRSKVSNQARPDRGTVATVLIVVGLIATLIPSCRALRIDPVAVLRRG